jgi:hypothetical protein
MLDSDGMNSSTRVPVCQAHVGTYGYVMSCLVVNGAASRGCRFRGHLSGTGNSWAWLLRARVHAEPGHTEELLSANKW